MKAAVFALAGAVAFSAAFAAAPMGTDARARELIATLHLTELKGESGYLGLIGDSRQMAQIDGRSLKVQSQVYYMLTRDKPVNFLHWLASDDTHILIEGGPVDYFIFHPDGQVEKFVLGRDIAARGASGSCRSRRLLESLAPASGRELRAYGQCTFARVDCRSRKDRRRSGVAEQVRRQSGLGHRRESEKSDWPKLEALTNRGSIVCDCPAV